MSQRQAAAPTSFLIRAPGTEEEVRDSSRASNSEITIVLLFISAPITAALNQTLSFD